MRFIHLSKNDRDTGVVKSLELSPLSVEKILIYFSAEEIKI